MIRELTKRVSGLLNLYGITVKDMAKALGISAAAMYYKIREDTITIRDVYTLHKAYGIDIMQFVNTVCAAYDREHDCTNNRKGETR